MRTTKRCVLQNGIIISLYFADFSEVVSPSPNLPFLYSEGFCLWNVAFINLSCNQSYFSTCPQYHLSDRREWIVVVNCQYEYISEKTST
jgi:hypothetical protein